MKYWKKVIQIHSSNYTSNYNSLTSLDNLKMLFKVGLEHFKIGL
jgi:hypothetical protein